MSATQLRCSMQRKFPCTVYLTVCVHTLVDQISCPVHVVANAVCDLCYTHWGEGTGGGRGGSLAPDARYSKHAASVSACRSQHQKSEDTDMF